MNNPLFKNFRQDENVDQDEAYFSIDPGIWHEYYRQRREAMKALHEGKYVWVGNWNPFREPLNALTNEIHEMVCTNSYACRDAYNEEDGERLEFVVQPWCGEDNYAIYAHLKSDYLDEDEDNDDEYENEEDL